MPRTTHAMSVRSGGDRRGGDLVGGVGHGHGSDDHGHGRAARRLEGERPGQGVGGMPVLHRLVGGRGEA